MQNAPNSPTGPRSESIAAFPPHDSGQALDALTEAPSAFDPAEWLAAFERVGGCWMVRDCLSLVIRVEDQPDAQLDSARRLVVGLTREHREAIVAHLREREA
jgi:hypothetical protein